jgi:hypothetical protein
LEKEAPKKVKILKNEQKGDKEIQTSEEKIFNN